jgi:hypothetical protein
MVKSSASLRGAIFGVVPVVFAAYIPFCTPAVHPTTPDAPPSALWECPTDLEQRDLFAGVWGAGHAPDRRAEYRFLRWKTGGVNPGVIVSDPQGREWHVKQPGHHGAEGPVEVVLSRVLSALGYHQPPVYYLPAFVMRDRSGASRQPGGRFRFDDPSWRARGEWSWQQNPFVGTRPYQGLLVVLLLFNSSDLKNSNNTLYDVRLGDRTVQRYVVRDLGAALGETGRIAPTRNDPELFARSGFITGITGGFVEFDYQGFHQELLRRRITADDVRWAGSLLARLSERQWHDAFRAGGYERGVAEKFVRALSERIASSQAIVNGEDADGSALPPLGVRVGPRIDEGIQSTWCVACTGVGAFRTCDT